MLSPERINRYRARTKEGTRNIDELIAQRSLKRQASSEGVGRGQNRNLWKQPLYALDSFAVAGRAFH